MSACNSMNAINLSVIKTTQANAWQVHRACCNWVVIVLLTSSVCWQLCLSDLRQQMGGCHGKVLCLSPYFCPVTLTHIKFNNKYIIIFTCRTSWRARLMRTRSQQTVRNSAWDWSVVHLLLWNLEGRIGAGLYMQWPLSHYSWFSLKKRRPATVLFMLLPS